jgi:hypothetical protein
MGGVYISTSHTHISPSRLTLLFLAPVISTSILNDGLLPPSYCSKGRTGQPDRQVNSTCVPNGSRSGHYATTVEALAFMAAGGLGMYEERR